MQLTWTSKPFNDLTTTELYSILQLRTEVFIVEQQCAFQDIDGHDAPAFHLLGTAADGQLAAYARLFAAGQSYAQVSIGRVAVAPAFRRFGLGQELMRQAIAHCAQLFGEQPIKIGAQQYLTRFYQGFGFVQQGEGSYHARTGRSAVIRSFALLKMIDVKKRAENYPHTSGKQIFSR